GSCAASTTATGTSRASPRTPPWRRSQPSGSSSTPWRWAGVPFLIRAGKKLPTTAAEVVVDFREPPLDIFGESVCGSRNSVRFRLSPEIVIALQARAKAPGEAMRGEQIELTVRQHRAETLPAP